MPLVYFNDIALASPIMPTGHDGLPHISSGRFRYRTLGDVFLRKSIPRSTSIDLGFKDNGGGILDVETARALRLICIDCWQDIPTLRPSVEDVLGRLVALFEPAEAVMPDGLVPTVAGTAAAAIADSAGAGACFPLREVVVATPDVPANSIIKAMEFIKDKIPRYEWRNCATAADLSL